MVAYIEEGWLDESGDYTLYRYQFPIEMFESLRDSGMYVSSTVTAIERSVLTDLERELENARVELRVVKSLDEVSGAVRDSLHISVIRTRYALLWRPQECVTGPTLRHLTNRKGSQNGK